MKMDKRLYGMLNKKIKNSGGGGSGGTSIYTKNATINEDGNLIITLSDGSVINAGRCVGPQGEAGETGATGPTGETGPAGKDGTNGVNGEDGVDGISPTIEVYSNTANSYQLKINNADGTSFITPNLRGTGGATTRYYVFDNALYTNFTDTIYTIYNGELKSVQDYIDTNSSFCHEKNNHALSYDTSVFGWAGKATSFSLTPMTIESTQMLLYGYISSASKAGEFIKFIPSGLVSGSTNLEKAQSIQTLLAAGNESIISLDFEFVYATNGVTEAVSLDSVPSGEYYVCWTATSDNSIPKINDITIV
jgi:hypothetical protein